MRIVLASRSPQRRELLARLGLDFEVVVPGVDEARGGDPEADVLESARRKAAAISARGALVIGCDTEVAIDGAALGKPDDGEAAREYLERLSGRSHLVVSGLAIVGPEPDRLREGVERSEVTFATLSEADIDRYVASGEWRERAGGYAIQGLGSSLVERLEGDLSNVIGLPLRLLLELAPELAPQQ